MQKKSTIRLSRFLLNIRGVAHCEKKRKVDPFSKRDARLRKKYADFAATQKHEDKALQSGGDWASFDVVGVPKNVRFTPKCSFVCLT